MKAKLIPLVVLALLAVEAPPAGAVRMGPPLASPASYVYVDLSQQRLVEVHHHTVTAVLHVSTGGGYRYTSSNGVSRIAVTPTPGSQGPVAVPQLPRVDVLPVLLQRRLRDPRLPIGAGDSGEPRLHPDPHGRRDRLLSAQSGRHAGLRGRLRARGPCRSA